MKLKYYKGYVGMYFLSQTAVHKRDVYKLYNQTDKALQISLRL